MSSDPCRDLLLLVRELHLRGYERMRISPGMSPSGMHWRCTIAPVTAIRRAHGARLARSSPASYSSADERAYFGWTDAAEAGPARLADLFLERFPAIAAAGRGRDEPYVRWYEEMLRLTEPDALPYAYADYETREDCLPTTGGPDRCVPLPPPGEAR